MLYVFGICERCKEPLELKLKFAAMDKSADISMRLVLLHRPQPIGSAYACGGHIKVVSTSEVEDDVARTILPLELWQILYEEGMSLRDIAHRFNVTQTKIRYELVVKARRHKIQVMPLRRVGRPSKSSRMEVST